MEKGKIYDTPLTVHPFVFLKNLGQGVDGFYAVFLTHSDQYSENIVLLDSHIDHIESEDSRKQLSCKRKLRKYIGEIGLTREIGKLTDAGYDFIWNKVKDLPAKEFKTSKG